MPTDDVSLNRQQRREITKIRKRQRREWTRQRDQVASKVGLGTPPEDIETTVRRIMLAPPPPLRKPRGT